MPADDFTPTDIRALRGDRTRAAFAAELGVNAHTVYRWELPIGAAHARRPRGEALASLRRMAERAAAPASDAAVLPVDAALERMLDGDWRAAEGVFLRAHAAVDASALARSRAAAGLALIELLYRADGRRALAALGPALAPGAPTVPLVEATAALAYAHPDGELFDLSHVHGHASRAQAVPAGGDAPLVEVLVIAAESNAALLAGDDDLLLRALARADAIASVTLPEIPALYVEQLRALSATMAGQSRVASERLDRLLAHPRLALSAPLEARVCAMRALRMLDDLGDPEAIVALAQRARRVADEAHLAVGTHTALSQRCLAEALLRLARLDEAAEVFAEADRILDQHRFPVAIVLPIEARYLLTTGQADALASLSARVGAIELPSLRMVCQALAVWLGAMAHLVRGDDPAAMLAGFAQAERLASNRGFLRRDFLVSYAGAALVEGDPDQARAVLTRALRSADRLPSAWVTAHLRRIEAILLLEQARADEGRTLFEAAVATFAASGDRLDAALSRFGCAGMLRVIGAPDAEARFAEAGAELAALGVPRPAWIERALARAARSVAGGPRMRAAAPVVATAPAAIELALQRLAAPGASRDMLLRELAAVAQDVAGAPVVIEPDEPGGGRAPRGSAVMWLDFAGGGGQRLRLGVSGLADPTDDQRAALRVVVLVAGLALEVAALRGGERPAAAPEAGPDVPGLVAVSPVMRRLLGDVGRLAGSRATVVVTGESGAGKEGIARALHELSPRASRPYVAFNCAAVPHELFEGQLFGYRKGAFTGAAADHQGVVRAADGGTLFLDEIGELPLDIQPKLLRFLDLGEVFPLGAQRSVTVDVRVVAATNRDLPAMVRAGRFREDLYYRLQVVPLVVPPLRERREDVVPLARHFARALADDGHPPAFAPDALAALAAHRWPGNVRELRNMVARAMAYAPRPDVITRAELGL